jgi:hypothetical protein
MPQEGSNPRYLCSTGEVISWPWPDGDCEQLFHKYHRKTANYYYKKLPCELHICPYFALIVTEYPEVPYNYIIEDLTQLSICKFL